MFLAEKIFVLTINEETGKKKEPYFFKYAIVGAVLLELLFKKKITLEKKRFQVLVHLVDSSATGEKIVDYFIREISEKSGGKSLTHWIKKFAMHDIVETMEIMFKTILEHGIILDTSGGQQLSFYKAKVIPLANPGVKQEILGDIKNVFTFDQQPDNISLALLSMLYANHSIKDYFKGNDKKLARKKMKGLLAKNEKSLLKQYSESIYYVTKAIRSVVSSANM